LGAARNRLYYTSPPPSPTPLLLPPPPSLTPHPHQVAFSDCTFDGNESTNGGGALFIKGSGTQITVTDTTFKNNHAFPTGGAIYVMTQTGTPAILTITDCTFTSNYAQYESSSNPGVALRGGAIDNQGCTITITDTTFTYNKVRYLSSSGTVNNNNSGEGIGGAICVSEGGTVTMTGGSFSSGNAARKGGAVMALSGSNGGNPAPTTTFTATATYFSNNDILYPYYGAYGGAIYNEDATINLNGCKVSESTGEGKRTAIKESS